MSSSTIIKTARFLRNEPKDDSIQQQNCLHDYIAWANIKSNYPNHPYSYPFYPPKDLPPWLCYQVPPKSYETSRDRDKHINYVLERTLRCRIRIKKIQRKYREYKQAQHNKYLERLRNLGKTIPKPSLDTSGELSGPEKVLT